MTSFLTPAVGITASPEQTGNDAWRETMLALWQYLRRDMRDAKVQQRRLYPVNHERHVIRPVAFVWALARELATPYSQPVTRRWVDLDGKPLGDEVQEMIRKEYTRAKVTRMMRNAHRQLVGMNCSTMWAWPDKANSGVKWRFIPPHEQEVQLLPFASTEDEVEFWRFRVPLPVRGDPQMFMGAVARVSVDHLEEVDGEDVLVKGRAFWEAAPGKLTGRGLYMQDGSNPFGLIPVVMLRGSEPAEGEWWPPAPDDILAAQRAATHDATDVGTIARLQGFGQPVMKGGTKDEEMVTGPETAVWVPIEGSFTFEQANAQIAEYVEQNKEFLATTIAMNGLSPATFTKSAAQTSTGRQMDHLDRDTYRREHLDILLDAEQRAYRVMRAIINWQRGGKNVWPEARVEVEYCEPKVPVDPLHDAQAQALDIANLQTGHVKARAVRDGISEAEAEKRILAEMAWREKHGIALPTAGGTQTDAKVPTSKDEKAETDAPEEGAETSTPAPDDGDETQAEGSPPNLAAAGSEVQKSALNGAQVAELRGTIQAVADGLLPPESARAIILAAYPIAPADVDAMLTPLASFEAKKPAAPAPFGAPPKPVPDDEVAA